MLLHTILTRSDVIGPVAARLAGVPYVVSSIEGKLISSFGIPSRWRRLAYYFGYVYSKKKIDRFIAISGRTKKDHCHDFKIDPAKIDVIHNGVEPERFPWRKSLEVSRERLVRKEPILGYFGVLGYGKDVGSLIEAFPLILKHSPKTKLLIVGEGPSKTIYQQRAQELGLERSIRFLPWVNDVAEVMLSFDIFILPSKSEGMPWAVLEAMASAKPVIASSVGGIPEAVIDGQTGILLPDSEPDSIAQAVFSLLESPEKTLEMALAARKRVEEKFTAAHEMKKIEELYDSLIKAGR